MSHAYDMYTSYIHVLKRLFTLSLQCVIFLYNLIKIIYLPYIYYYFLLRGVLKIKLKHI